MLDALLGTFSLPHLDQAIKFQGLSQVQKGAIFRKLMYIQGTVEVPPTPWKLKSFAKWNYKRLTMCSVIFDLEDDTLFTKGYLGTIHILCIFLFLLDRAPSTLEPLECGQMGKSSRLIEWLPWVRKGKRSPHICISSQCSCMQFT